MRVCIELKDRLAAVLMTAIAALAGGCGLPASPAPTVDDHMTAKPSALPSIATGRALFAHAAKQWAILADSNASASQQEQAMESLRAMRLFVEMHEFSPAPSLDDGWCGTNALMLEHEREGLRSIFLVETDPGLIALVAGLTQDKPKPSPAIRGDLLRVASDQRDDCRKYASDTASCLDTAMVPIKQPRTTK